MQRLPVLGRAVAAARSIRGRIVTAFIVMSLLAGAVGGCTAYVIHEAGKPFGRESESPSVVAARAAASDFAKMRGRFDERWLSTRSDPDPSYLASHRALLADLAHVDGLRDADWEGILSDVRVALASLDKAMSDFRPDAIAASWSGLNAAADSVGRRLEALVLLTGQRDAVERSTVRRTIDWDFKVALGCTGLVLLLSGVVSWLLARRVIKPLAAAALVAERIAQGQLHGEIPNVGDDELGALLSTMGAMRNNIRAVMEREVALRRSAQTRLADAIESSQDGIIVVDADLRIALANAQASNFLGASAGMLEPGTPIMHLTGASRSSRQLLLDLMGLAGNAEESLLPDGRWLRVSRSATRDGGFIALCSDISVQKDQEAKLKATNLRLDAALENMSQGLCLYGSDLTLHVVNRRFGEIFGLRPDAIVAGMSLREVFDRLMQAGHFPLRSGEEVFRDELALFTKREHAMRFLEIGGGRVVGVAMEALSDGGWLATYEDVTERRQAEERIAFMARHDALTNLPNRVLFAERVEQAIAQTNRGRHCAVFCLDLDHFKQVNDTLGHPIGDQLLRSVADRLLACARDCDTVARLGGDEFALVQVDIETPEQAVTLANRIIERLSTSFAIEGHSVSIGVSIGISMAPGDGQNHSKLLKNADVALYRAKEDGRGTWRFFEAEMDSRLQARREMETDLRRAVEEEQFEVHYQPQFDLRMDRIVGFEALVRWRHPVRGMVPPGDFIPLAEEIGLIREIGGWVLRTACLEASRWSSPLRIAVNVSPVQLRHMDFCATVADALALSGLPSKRLELEITESVMLSNSAAALDLMHRIRGLGVQFSMDDFGTGYSSLTSLRSFPFEKIKIDKSFVQDLTTSSGAESVIRAVIVLAGGMGIRSTAEGVETPEQMAQLRTEGCGEVQGYLISPPKPASAIPGMLERWNGGARRGLMMAVA